MIAVRNKIYGYVISPLVFLSLIAFLAPAYAQMMCPMDDLLHHLPVCVTHHYTMMGDMDNQGVYTSLLSKAQNAVSLNDQGNTDAAVNVLNSFINELQAQKGKHVPESAADMLINHAQMAINQIS